MSSELLTQDVSQHLMRTLGCKQKLLSSLIGVSENSLSLNGEKPFGKLKRTKTGRRLLSLLFVTETLTREDATLSPAVLYRSLTLPRYPMADGTVLDVVTGIRREMQKELLLEIVKPALTALRKHAEEKKPAEDFYQRACSA